MNNDVRVDHDDEVDFSEIVAAVRPAVLPAAIVGLLCGIGGIAYALTLEREYVATAKFTIDGASNNQFPSLGGAFGGLVTPQGGTNESVLASGKIMSRDAIVGLFDTTGIDTDPFFTGEGAPSGPIGMLKNAVLGARPVTPERTRERIVATFRRVTSVDLRDSGIIDVRVRHSDPAAAAAIANSIVNTHIARIENKRLNADQRQVDLTKQRLLKAQKDLDDSQDEARVYAIENNIRSQEDLGTSSMKLTRFRSELEKFDALLAGLKFLEQKRQTSSSGRIDVNEFFKQFPVAFTTLERNLGWIVESGNLVIPPASRIAAAREPLFKEREQIQRSLFIIETEAERNAQAAGRLGDLNRRIEVNKALYARLVQQLEARDLVAELQKDERVERIQKAVPPLTAVSPRISRFAALSAIFGLVAVIGWRLFRTLRSGVLYTGKRIGKALKTAPVAEGIGRAAGRQQMPLSRLLKQTKRTANSGIVNLALTLRDEETKILMVLGTPGTPAVGNLASLLGYNIADHEERVAVVNLSTAGADGYIASTRSHGVMKEVEQVSSVTRFDWIEKPPGSKDAMSIDQALEDTQKSFDRMVIASAPLRWGTLYNNAALNLADRVLVLASGGKTTQSEIGWVRKLFARRTDTKYDLVLA